MLLMISVLAEIQQEEEAGQHLEKTILRLRKDQKGALTPLFSEHKTIDYSNRVNLNLTLVFMIWNRKSGVIGL